jgi:hypothetical protein
LQIEGKNKKEISPAHFSAKQSRMFDTTMIRTENKNRQEFLQFLTDAWNMQPKYISKHGPRHCNFSEVIKVFKESMLLPMFGREVAFFLNGNTNLEHDDFSFPITDSDTGRSTVIQSFTINGLFKKKIKYFIIIYFF